MKINIDFYKQCPSCDKFCHLDIDDKAINCEHCGEEIEITRTERESFREDIRRIENEEL